MSYAPGGVVKAGKLDQRTVSPLLEGRPNALVGRAFVCSLANPTVALIGPYVVNETCIMFWSESLVVVSYVID